MATWTRTVMEFNGGQQKGGWSEVYIFPEVTVNDAVDKLTLLAGIRTQILSSQNVIDGFRVTLPLVGAGVGFIRRQRKAYFKSVSIAGGIPPIASGSDLLQVGVMVRLMDNTKSNFKNQTYRGVPDQFWENGNDTNARSAMLIWLGRWLLTLATTGASILHKDRILGLTPLLIQNAEYQRMVVRKTGRPFGALRGVR